MKLFCLGLLGAALALSTSANDVTGTWKAVFVGPLGGRPKMVSEMIFDIKTDGNTITGIAHMGNWPGDAPLSDGKIDAGRISFTAIGSLPFPLPGTAAGALAAPRVSAPAAFPSWISPEL